jgi:hypothetical protein
MLSTQGYAAMTAKAALRPFSFERREVGPHDVLITISHWRHLSLGYSSSLRRMGRIDFPYGAGP